MLFLDDADQLQVDAIATGQSKKNLMSRMIAHFEEPRIVNLHVFSVFGTPIDSKFEKRTTIIVLASLLLITIEIVIYNLQQSKRES